MEDWYRIANPDGVITPALLVYPERIEHNIDLMLHMAGGPEWLRPHVKTYKNAEIIKMQLAKGITRFKCATIAEAELLAQSGAPDVLLAMQPVGANIGRLGRLIKSYPQVQFSALVDHPDNLVPLGNMAQNLALPLSLYLDLNVGMNRTGIIPGETAKALYVSLAKHAYLKPAGLHAYDGHLRDTNVTKRSKQCDAAFAPVKALATALQETLGTPIPIIAGGSPTFPFHAKRKGVTASPGTTLLWDDGYGSNFPEMGFLPAAVLMTRVISIPKKGRVCYDLGHKSIAPEMPFPRLRFLDLKGVEQIGQSEEHLVVAVPTNSTIPGLGDLSYGIPRHICPTVAKYEELQVVEGGKRTTSWKVQARNQKINI